ncbi:predicted Zn-dependent peptidases [Candidatus Vecturithrix granuli]|uniref:Predicted Zn-dependent peptidases n=1 Tax=Vecturithrix granuli TaxID=1499967 RepID=A0A081C882_VECG1|nr:predicted Zn-dependent peptidases [Candidatus Vecturithrix granuli]
MNIQSPELDITKTVFENGLTLLVLEKRDVPLVTSTIWYKVGSAYERKGQTGISHFLEHLMFKGTSTYAKGVIDAMTAAYGGYNNAGTIFDYTMYYFNFSSDRWQIALEIEADRMQHCLFDPAEFEAERNVVLEELKHQLDSPWGRLSIQMEATLYPQEHPYHHPVIGWREDLERITPAEVNAYYQTYYTPNNATIVIVGDVETQAAIEQVYQHFAHIPANPNLPVLQACAPKQAAEQRFVLHEDTGLKRVQIGYHAAALVDEENYALEVIDYLLSHGKTSCLYQRLIENEQLVSFIDTCNHPRRFPGAFYIFAALRPGVESERVEQAIDEELKRLQRELLPLEELDKVKNAIAADFIFEKETAAGLAHSLGEYETLSTYKYIYLYPEHLARITSEDIMRTAQTYLTETNRTVGWSLPEHPEQERPESLTAEEEDFLPPTLEIAHYTPEIPDRQGKMFQAKPPSPETPYLFTRDTQRYRHYRWTLDNGLIVLFLEQHTLPVLSMEAFVDAGQQYETDEQAGLAVLTGQLLDEGTTRRSSFEIAQTIEAVGGSLETQSRGVSVQVLSKDIELAMDLLADVLIHPVFDAAQLEKKRQRILTSLEGDEDNLALVAYNLFREMVYGRHPYHRPYKGYKHTLQQLSRADVVAYFDVYFRPNRTILAIVGDATPEFTYDAVQRCFGDWEARILPEPPGFTIPRPQGCVQKHLERAREQVHVYLGHPGVTRLNPDFYTLFTLDHILGVGAGFTDRISRKLRDEQGLAYSVSANISLSAEVEPGVFSAYIGTSPKNVQRAIEGFLEEIHTIRTTPVSQEELALAQNYITGSYVFNFETSNQLARYLINMERYHLGDQFIWNFPHLIQSVTIEAIQQAAQRYLDPENYYIASVGKGQIR